MKFRVRKTLKKFLSGEQIDFDAKKIYLDAIIDLNLVKVSKV